MKVLVEKIIKYFHVLHNSVFIAADAAGGVGGCYTHLSVIVQEMQQ